jgi:hypothetical protein
MKHKNPPNTRVNLIPVEELEAGYKNAAKVYQENENLKKQIESLAKAPEEYVIAKDMRLAEDDLNAIKDMAKNASLTQSQFEALALEHESRAVAKQKAREQAFKEVGEENLNVLKDYVAKSYPEKVAESVLEKLVLDKEAREAALAHRQQLLNSAVPGMNKTSYANYQIEYEDVLKARDESQKSPHLVKLRDRYLNLMAQYANQRKS